MTTTASLISEDDVRLNTTERTNLTDTLFKSTYNNKTKYIEMKSSFEGGKEECGKDCGLQYLNILKVTSKGDKNSSISQDSFEETSLYILRDILNKSKNRLSLDGNKADNSLDNPEILEDDESYLMGSILDNLLITKSERDANITENDTETITEESKGRYKSIKESGEDLGYMLTKGMSPSQPPRIFKGTKMQILGAKGSKELDNVIGGVDVEFTCSNSSFQSDPGNNAQNEEESQLFDINLIEWDSSVYNFNIEEKSKLVSNKVTSYNMYQEDQTTKITNKTVEFRVNITLAGMNEEQVKTIFCTYYDETKQKFSTQGINVIERNIENGYLRCNSTHMSDFGLTNETLTILTNANFEEATEISELKDYKFYQSIRIYIYIYIYSLLVHAGICITDNTNISNSQLEGQY